MANITKKKEIRDFVDSWVSDRSKICARKTLLRVQDTLRELIDHYDMYRSYNALTGTSLTDLKYCLEVVQNGLKKLNR